MSRVGYLMLSAWVSYILFLVLPAVRAIDISRAGFEMVLITLRIPPFEHHTMDQPWVFFAWGLSHFALLSSPLVLLVLRRSLLSVYLACSAVATALQLYMVWWLLMYDAVLVGLYLCVVAFMFLTADLYRRFFSSKAGEVQHAV